MQMRSHIMVARSVLRNAIFYFYLYICFFFPLRIRDRMAIAAIAAMVTVHGMYPEERDNKGPDS